MSSIVMEPAKKENNKQITDHRCVRFTTDRAVDDHHGVDAASEYNGYVLPITAVLF